ncbi:LuxR C-terminal-related transcriptional regulator [Actinomadura gamaensis]|uniref:LuxR C-terminal-related transcriptional regulator n=1 Tax=Actinomadura gamaensis TaxID=1763541 RepID=A0ABV9TSB9_9ACTN
MTVRVIVLDRQALTRLGVRMILEAEPDLELVAEARTGRELVPLVAERRPDIVLVGLPLAEGEASELVRNLVADGGRRPGVVVMAASAHEASLLETLRAGVRGVVGKDCPPHEIVRAIRVVASGGAVLTSAVTGQLLDWVARVPVATSVRPAVAEALSDRERHVLELVAGGLSDTEIAEELHVSTATVRSHVHHITAKLGVPGRAQVVAFAFRQGLVAGEPAGRG